MSDRLDNAGYDWAEPTKAELDREAAQDRSAPRLSAEDKAMIDSIFEDHVALTIARKYT